MALELVRGPISPPRSLTAAAATAQIDSAFTLRRCKGYTALLRVLAGLAEAPPRTLAILEPLDPPPLVRVVEALARSRAPRAHPAMAGSVKEWTLALHALQGLVLQQPAARLAFAAPTYQLLLLHFLTHTAGELLVAALEALQLVLLDAPPNLRAFEQLGGLPFLLAFLRRHELADDTRHQGLVVLAIYILPEPRSPLSASPRDKLKRLEQHAGPAFVQRLLRTVSFRSLSGALHPAPA